MAAPPKKELNLFRLHQQNPLQMPAAEVKRQLGIKISNSPEFYRRFYRAWKIDRLNSDEVNPQE